MIPFLWNSPGMRPEKFFYFNINGDHYMKLYYKITFIMLLLLAIVFPACDDDGDPTTKITIEYDAIMDAGITSSSASRTFGGDYNAWTGFNTIDSKVWSIMPPENWTI